jgi:phage recombination protein Bet
MTDLVAPENTNLVADPNGMSRERLELIKRTICKGSTDDELAMFIQVCKRTGLAPETRQIYAVKRYDSRERRDVMSIQISIDGFRLIAERSRKYAGQLGAFFCADDGVWKDVWLKATPPVAAKVAVLRSDFKEPLWAVVRFESYAQKKNDGSLSPMWAKMPDVMLAKCAESLALRKAFPQELSGLYTIEEMEQATDYVDLPKNHSPNQQLQSTDSQLESNRLATDSQPTANNQPATGLSNRLTKMLKAFLEIGMVKEQLEAICGMKFELFGEAQIAQLQAVYPQHKAAYKLGNESDQAKLEQRFSQTTEAQLPNNLSATSKQPTTIVTQLS